MSGRKRLGNNSLELLKNVGERVKKQAKKDSSKEKDKDSQLNQKEGGSENSMPNIGIPELGILKIGIPEKSFCKVHNWIFDELPKALTTSEWIVYLHLYRLSLGYQNENCTIGYGGLANRTGLARNTVRNAIKGLIEKEYIVDGKSSQDGTVFTIGVPDSGIPNAGIPNLGIPIDGMPKNDTLGVPNKGMPIDGIPDNNTDNKGNHVGVPNLGIPKIAPNKDSIKDINKDNNNRAVLLLLSSKTINLPEPTMYTLAEKTDCKNIEKWLKFIEDKKKEIDNPSGFFRCAIEQGWEIPPKWESSYERKKEMEKQAKEEEEKIAREKAQWEDWLGTVSEEMYQEAERFAKKKVKDSPFTPKSEEVKNDMLEGFKKEFLRTQYEQAKKKDKNSSTE